jgi:16S rRNA processing protein RimM
MAAPPRNRGSNPAGDPPSADAPANLVVVGRIGAAHGVGGAMHITSFTEPPDNIARYRPWLLGESASFRQVTVETVKPHGKGFVARLAGITDREQAQSLAGLLIAVARQSLPALPSGEEYYWRDLVGLTVCDRAGRNYGKVVRMLDTGVHDVLVIAGEQETLIPFVADFVLEVDLAGGRILVEWSDPI